ncbi:DUF4870 family protein [Thaumasiovibrio subtropicus]|uniref:DUF4870 family protein n=1 Tax=Thaumasiovibrio subtropicus TaxID=1891207 RepID=UPI000B35D9CF|nr:hypothetical protein [Thaumasiovibrio subtropicus]
MDNNVVVESQSKDASNLRKHAIVCYALMLLGILTWGIAGIGGLIYAYIKRGDASQTIYEGHFGNIIKTFWICFVLGVVGFITSFIGIGFIILFAAAIYNLYKMIKGLLRAVDNKALA